MKSDTLLQLATELGTEIEFKVGYAREIGNKKWVKRQTLYNRLYMRGKRKVSK